MLTAEDPLTRNEIELMMLYDGLMCDQRAEEIALNPPLRPDWVDRIDRNIPDPPFGRFRPLARVLSEADIRMGADRRKRAAIASDMWHDLRRSCVGALRQELRNTPDFEHAALIAISVYWSLAVIFLAILLFRLKLPGFDIASTAMANVLLVVGAKAVVIEFPGPRRERLDQAG